VLRNTNRQLDDEDKVANVFETLGHPEARMVVWSNISLRHLASFVDRLQLNSFSEPVRANRRSIRVYVPADEETPEQTTRKELDESNVRVFS
jgi:predicted HAD superfamily phosphohydrolase YqeG